MARRSQRGDPEQIRQELISLLCNFEQHLLRPDLREKVLALIPARHLLNDLGCSLINDESNSRSARDRLLAYLRRYPKLIIGGDELGIIAGISEYARRLRELRTQFGWALASGITISEMIGAGEILDVTIPQSGIRPDDYILLSENQDRDSAHRWRLANEIRKNRAWSVQKRLIEFFVVNVGHMVTNEELRYVAGDSTEWARRVRELRTEHGWKIATKNTGRPDLPIGGYVLESLDQLPEHDRKIRDEVRAEVLQRDNFSCQHCGWTRALVHPDDPRVRLELHHEQHHAKGGSNNTDNLLTLCNVCHDICHRD